MTYVDPNLAALMQKFRTAQPGRADRMPKGTHYLAIIEYSIRPTDDYGNIIGIDYEVLQSDSVPVGSKVSDAFFVSKSDKEGGKAEVTKAMNATNAITGAPPNDADKFADATTSFVQPTQPARGLVVKCTCVEKSKIAGPKSKNAGQMVTYRDNHYETVADQSHQREIRASLDQKYPIAAVVAPPPLVPQAPPPGYGYPPAAPAPQAPPPGYGYPPAAPAPQAPPMTWQQPQAAHAAAPGVPASLAAFVPR